MCLLAFGMMGYMPLPITTRFILTMFVFHIARLLTIDDFPTSRSGRKLVPPLPHWTSERKVYYPGLEVTGIIPGTPNDSISSSTMQFQEDKVIRQYWFDIYIRYALFTNIET